MNDISDDERHALAKELGYRKIGKELPDGVSLNDVVQSMPKEVRNAHSNTPELNRPRYLAYRYRILFNDRLARNLFC